MGLGVRVRVRVRVGVGVRVRDRVRGRRDALGHLGALLLEELPPDAEEAHVPGEGEGRG